MNFKWIHITRKSFLLQILLFALLGGLGWLCSSLTVGTKSIHPNITVKNITACLAQNGKKIFVKDLEVGVPQFICADMTVDRSDVYLDVIIESAGNTWMSPYIMSNYFEPGSIFFPIEPALPIGKYRARIRYARTTFADIYFAVIEK